GTVVDLIACLLALRGDGELTEQGMLGGVNSYIDSCLDKVGLRPPWPIHLFNPRFLAAVGPLLKLRAVGTGSKRQPICDISDATDVSCNFIISDFCKIVIEIRRGLDVAQLVKHDTGPVASAQLVNLESYDCGVLIMLRRDDEAMNKVLVDWGQNSLDFQLAG